MSVQSGWATPESYTEGPGLWEPQDKAHSRLPPQGRAGRRALVSGHASNSATLGSEVFLPAWKAKDKADLAEVGEGSIPVAASVSGTRENGFRPTSLQE